MAVKRSMNWLGAQRVDVPHLRMVESAVAADFQTLSGTVMAGSRALVVWGFNLLNSGAAVGTAAGSLVLHTAGGSLLHATATEAGAIYAVVSNQPDEVLGATNPAFGTSVIGTFTPGTTNYVGVDLVRTADISTEDAVVFRSLGTGQEFTQTVPLARTTNYVIHISTTDFSFTPELAPICKVVTDANNNVVSITDCRNQFFRLGTGGVTPNVLSTYTWSNRNEGALSDKFSGGDKDIQSQYDWNRAIMSRVWEVGGGEHWYSATADREVLFTRDPAVIFTDNENFEVVANNVHWQGLYFYFGNSTAERNIVAAQLVNSAGLTDLAVGDCLYVDLNRAVDGATITAHKAALLTLGSPTIPGSRQILAWRTAEGFFSRGITYPIGAGPAHASNTAFGTVKLFTQFAPDAANPVVPVMDAVTAFVLADPTAQANVVARGITRDVAGNLLIGPGSTTLQLILGGLNAGVTSYTKTAVAYIDAASAPSGFGAEVTENGFSVINYTVGPLANNIAFNVQSYVPGDGPTFCFHVDDKGETRTGKSFTAGEEFKYYGGKTEKMFLSVADGHMQSSGTITILTAGVPQANNPAGGVVEMVWTFHIPRGATVTSAGYSCSNASGVAVNFNLTVDVVVKSATTFTSSSLLGVTTVSVASGATQWNVSNITNHLVVESEWVAVTVYSDASAGAGDLVLLGAYVAYTLPQVATQV